MSSWSRWNSWRYCGQYLNKYWWNFVRYMYIYARVCQCVCACVWECMCRRAHSISTVNIISLKMWSHLYGTWLALPKSDNSSQKITLLQVMKVSMIGLLPLSYSFPPVFLLVSPSSYLLISVINCAERNVTHAKSSKSKSKIKFESQSQRQRQRKRLKQNVF